MKSILEITILGFGFGTGFVRFGFEKIRIQISKNIEKMDALTSSTRELKISLLIKTKLKYTWAQKYLNVSGFFLCNEE